MQASGHSCKPQNRPAALLLAILFAAAVCCLMPPPAAGADDQPLTYRLKWLINMSTVGDAYAQVRGFFKTSGLAVEIKPGGPETDAIRELELRHADFGVVSADQMIRALAKGAPMVVVAQLFQNNPLHWIYRPDRITLTGPRDLAGKTLGVTFGKNDEIIMRTLLARGGIDDSRVRLFSVRLDYTPFYEGRVDLWPVYINSQGVEIAGRMAAGGHRTAFFNPADHGVRFVANSVITSRKAYSENPGLVRSFTRALMAAWRESLDPGNAEAALSAVRRFDRDTSEANLRAQLDATRRLVVPAGGAPVGTIDREAWRQTEQIMLNSRQIDAPVNVESCLAPELLSD